MPQTALWYTWLYAQAYHPAEIEVLDVTKDIRKVEE